MITRKGIFLASILIMLWAVSAHAIVGSGCEQNQKTFASIHNTTGFITRVTVTPYSCQGTVIDFAPGEAKTIELGYCGLRSIAAQVPQDYALGLDRDLQARYEVGYDNMQDKCGPTGPWEIVAQEPKDEQDSWKIEIIKKRNRDKRMTYF